MRNFRGAGGVYICRGPPGGIVEAGCNEALMKRMDMITARGGRVFAANTLRGHVYQLENEC